MRIHGHTYHECDDPWAEAPPWAIELRCMLELIICNQELIMAVIDDLETSVKEMTDAEESAEAAFVKLADMIAALKTNQTDPATAARIQAAADQLKARAARLAAAVVANTEATA